MTDEWGSAGSAGDGFRVPDPEPAAETSDPREPGHRVRQTTTATTKEKR